MITCIRGCVAQSDLWPWPISSRSFRHDFAIKLLKCVRPACRVRSVTSTVLDGLFPYWTQMITSMVGCVVVIDLWPWPMSSRSLRHEFAIKLLNMAHFVVSVLQHVQFWMDSFHICHKWSLAWEGVPWTLTLDLDLYLQGYSATTLQ